MDRPVAAFFDLDRTLLNVNSATLWAKHELASGNINASQFVRVAFWNALYHLSLIDIENAFERAVTHYRGRQYDELQRETETWFHRDVAHRLRFGAQKALDHHKAENHEVVILTSASCFEASVASKAWSIEHYLANEFPTGADGRLLGTFVRPLCYGRGKVERAKCWAADHGAQLSDAYFYTDSFTDAPMLYAVGHPRVVCPDPRLRREAKRRGWPILDW